MPNHALKTKMIETLKPPKTGRLELRDRLVPGFGLRVTDKGAKTWFVKYRVDTPEGRKQRRLTLGEVYVPPKSDPNDGQAASEPTREERGSLLTLAEAREEAREALRKLGRGIDPAEEKKPTRSITADTVKEVANDYLARYVAKHTAASTHRETKRIMDVDVLPMWGSRPISTITRRDVAALVDTIAARGAEIQANRVLARLKTFFNWCVKEEVISKSPIGQMDPPVREIARDRALSDDEIRWFWQGCERLGWPFGGLFKLLLATAQRRDEVGVLGLRELDPERRLWVIPRERAKNNRAHEVQLSDLAIEILTAVKVTRPKIEEIEKSDLLFTTNGRTPVSGFSRAKRRIDQSMEQLARKARGLPEDEVECRKALKLKPPEPLPRLVPDWILHDLRRTAATGMARLNIAPHVVDKILNHVEGTIRGVAAVYNRHDYSQERGAALEAWGRYITSLMKPATDNVVPMRAAQ